MCSLQSPDHCDAVGQVLNSSFGSDKNPAEYGVAATMLVVGKEGFVDPQMLVEVEMDAVVL